MANATTAASNEERVDFQVLKAVLKSSEVVAPKRFAVLDANGQLKNPSGTATEKAAGYFVSDEGGLQGVNTTYRTGDGSIKWITHSGKSLVGLSISGSTAASEGQLVWATDNSTLTLTPQAGVSPHGYVHEWRSATDLDVYFFTQAQVAAMSAGTGSGIRIIHQRVDAIALEGTSKITVGKHLMESDFQVLSVRAICSAAGASAAGDQDLSLEIDGTAVTGGVVNVTNSNTAGQTIAGSAITAANTGSAGEELSVVVDASGTGFSAGHKAAYDVQIRVIQAN